MIADILPACLASADAFDDSPAATAFPDVEAPDVEELVVPSVDSDGACQNFRHHILESTPCLA